MVDHKGFRVDRFKQMACGDIVHVKRRVLTHQDHIGFARQINHPCFAQIMVVAMFVAQRHRADFRLDPAPVIEHVIGMIVQKVISPRLGFKAHDKGRIPLDIDALDRVHLDGDDTAH